MSASHNHTDEQTTLLEPFMRGLGPICIAHPPATFSITPASLITIQAIVENQQLLAGHGLDWGTGTGCLAITAARIPTVETVFGLDISAANIDIAKQNANANRLDKKTTFFVADSYTPTAPADRKFLGTCTGQLNFILANPPSSEGDDGFTWRRRVLKGARAFLTSGGNVFLSISSQYGQRRVDRLCEEVPGFTYGGVLTTTDWTPFDLNRSDLMQCLQRYAAEEDRGGLKYAFHGQAGNTNNTLDACTALAIYEKSGESPLMKWQTHLLSFNGT